MDFLRGKLLRGSPPAWGKEGEGGGRWGREGEGAGRWGREVPTSPSYKSRDLPPYRSREALGQAYKSKESTSNTSYKSREPLPYRCREVGSPTTPYWGRKASTSSEQEWRRGRWVGGGKVRLASHKTYKSQTLI